MCFYLNKQKQITHRKAHMQRKKFQLVSLSVHLSAHPLGLWRVKSWATFSPLMRLIFTSGHKCLQSWMSCSWCNVARVRWAIHGLPLSASGVRKQKSQSYAVTPACFYTQPSQIWQRRRLWLLIVLLHNAPRSLAKTVINICFLFPPTGFLTATDIFFWFTRTKKVIFSLMYFLNLETSI